MYPCPKCKTEKLTSRYKNKKIPYLWCFRCDGVLYIGPVINKLLRQDCLEFLKDRTKNHPLSRGLSCVSCKKPYQVYEYHGDKKTIEIDFCPRCHHLWLEKEEVQVFAEDHYKDSTLETSMDFHVVSELDHTKSFYERLFFGLINISNVQARKLQTYTYGVYLILCLSLVIFMNPAMNYILMFHPDSPNFLKFIQLITYAVTHADHEHIIANSLALISFGIILESYIGTKKFLKLFFFSSVVSVVPYYLFVSKTIPLTGASAGIYGVMGALFALMPNSLVSFGRFFFHKFFMQVNLPVYIYFGFYFFADLYYSLSIPAGETDVAHIAHVSGFLLGYVFALVELKLKPDIEIPSRFRRKRKN